MGADGTIARVNTDFRDRISIAVWGVIMTLAISSVVNLPGRGASVVLGSRTIALPVAAASAIPVVLALLAGTGAQAVISAHPLARQGRLRLPVRFWALPVAVTLIAAFALPRAPSILYWAAGLLGVAVLLSGVLVALFYSIDPEAVGYRRSRAVLNLTCYAIALLLFLLIPDSWPSASRSVVLGGVAALLALELLRGSRATASSVTLYALVVGAVVTQVAWALLHVGLSTLSTGLLLLLLFYLLIGLAWQTLVERLNRRVALEFGLVGLVGLGLILIFAP